MSNLNNNTVQILNKYFQIASLGAAYTQGIATLVHKYIEDQNCRPALWIEDNKNLSTEQKACFIWHCLNHEKYKH